MGRIGRLLLRRLVDQNEHELVAVNDVMEQDNLLYLLKFDSIYGAFPGSISSEGNSLHINGKKIRIFQEDHPSRLPWKELDVDIVLECSGKFTGKALAEEHLKAGAGRVLLSTTGAPDVPLMVYGFNQSALKADMRIISPGGCMTNCSVHIIYILNAIGIVSAQLNILHSYTSRQELTDAPHTQYRRGRAAAESIIPVEIDLQQSLERIMPGMKNKIAAVSTRVPVANGAMADFSIQLASAASVKQVNALFKKAADNEYKGILAYTEDQLVSADIRGNSHSCVVDGSLTSITGNHLKLIVWFDNEFGFTSRMLDWVQYLKKF